MTTLVLIDGPNTFNDVDRWFEKSAAPHDNIRRDYFRDWFDLDRLVYGAVEQADIGDFRSVGLGGVIFHSEKAVGRSSVRLANADADAFWGRQALAPGMSTVLVSVPGHQPERSRGVCEKCKESVMVESVTEKGVDTSMVTYLYEAIDQWQEAVLVTSDADFVPPIQALRRRGKKVFVVAVDSEGSGALKRACQTFYAVPPSVLERDIATYNMLRPGGPLDRALDAFGEKFGDAARQQIRIAVEEPMPILVIPQTDGSWENFLADSLGSRSTIAWFDRGPRRTGGIYLGKESANLGVAVERHLGAFKGAKWLAQWRPFV